MQKITKIRSKYEYDEHTKHIAHLINKRKIIETELAKNQENIFYINGYCDPCAKNVRFLVDWNYSDGYVPNYRERLLCDSCGLNNRQRYIATVAKSFVKKHEIPSIFIYEQVTSFYNHLKNNPLLNVTGSEYLGLDIASGSILNGIRHENALSLSFSNKSFNMIISNDVYEHVPDINKALLEAFRTLKRGSVLLISIPFHSTKLSTAKRADLRNERIEHLLEPQYHGNPISQEGSLVFYDFGWDFIELCYKAGFDDAYMLPYYDLEKGYIGEGLQYIFVAEKYNSFKTILNIFRNQKIY